MSNVLFYISHKVVWLFWDSSGLSICMKPVPTFKPYDEWKRYALDRVYGHNVIFKSEVKCVCGLDLN